MFKQTPWVQVFVRAPEESGYDHPTAMKRVDNALVERTHSMAYIVHRASLPVRGDDGTWEVCVLEEEALKLVRDFLASYGLEIVREVKRDASDNPDE